ncbi:MULTISPECIES: molybdate ABC transporter substrate-binding protein [unclassified Methylophilus]|uniref:Molybdate ABC transporter substrate-binding protein n=1 Tax=Methylophilus glucosoxydans TaxID=752553 RepID=A0ABW3GIZ3_9PROT|nr:MULTISPECIES: molybdate ABC transporter substrate-binding protein [unclassified Methylophilus]MDT7848098.1 molybdate ABC transporter substrate-binding protein [Methylophilus sp. VKM B-3414]BEV07516.1 molybdate ABC transporter substrate-binding protein [Methylophilus sp. DW102]
MRSLKQLLIASVLAVSMQVQAAEPFTVAIAANLKYVFDDLAAEFKQETGIEAQSVLNASGKIATQVRQGAPFDVFMSADMEFPEGLYKEGFAVTAPKPYAYGLLVLWSQTGADLSKGVAGLTDAAIGKVAIANPKLAPFGKQALKAMEFYKVKVALEPKLVYGESITQVSQYVDSKAVDVGFSAKSIVVAPETTGKGKWVAVPEESYEPIAQGVVILKHGIDNNADAARKFYGFVQSEKARAIFAKNGYKLP